MACLRAKLRNEKLNNIGPSQENAPGKPFALLQTIFAASAAERDAAEPAAEAIFF